MEGFKFQHSEIQLHEQVKLEIINNPSPCIISIPKGQLITLMNVTHFGLGHPQMPVELKKHVSEVLVSMEYFFEGMPACQEIIAMAKHQKANSDDQN